MSNNLVLLTGGTGFIGFRVLRHLLEFNYHVRVVVRSESKAALLRSNAALKALGKEASCTYVVVPDFTAPGAFDKVTKDVTYVLHLAAPIPVAGADIPAEQYESFFVDASVKGTLNVLSAAKISGTVKRVLLLSTGRTAVPGQFLGGTGPDSTEEYDAESRAPQDPKPWPNQFAAYGAAKIAARAEAEAWMKENKPAFDAVHVLPAYVIGRDELSSTTKDLLRTTNSAILRFVTGRVQPGPPESCKWTDLDTLSLILIKALDVDRVAGNQSYLYTESYTWAQVSAYISKKFSGEIEKGVIQSPATLETKPLKTNDEKTRKAFQDIQFKNPQQMIDEAVGQYLELLGKEQAA